MTEPFLAPEVAAPPPAARARRCLAPNPFADDDGSQPAAFAAAKAVAPPDRIPAVVAALAGARVLLPVLAHPHPGRTANGSLAPHGAAGRATTPDEACEQAATVAVELPDGRHAMPIFTSVEAMRRWNVQARPVPVLGERAARAAAGAGDGLMLLDPGEDAVLIPRPAVRALASGAQWVPPWRDDSLALVAASALAGIREVAGVRIEPGRTTEVRVVTALRSGLDAAQLRDVIARVSAALSDDPVLRERVDSIELYPTSLA